MREFEIIVGLVLVASVAQPIARRFDVPVAIAQVVCGLLLSAIPFVSQVRLDPELTFTLFVPPVLFRAATTGTPGIQEHQEHQELKKRRLPRKQPGWTRINHKVTILC